jgi:replicative DNA helicase
MEGRILKLAPKVEWNPWDIGCEQALLGAILVNNEAYARVADLVIADDFYEGVHRTIFDLMSQRIDAGLLISPLTLKAFLPEFDLYEGMPVSRYLAKLAANAITIINAPDFAKVIRELADRRRLLDIAGMMGPTEATEARQIATDAIEALDAIASYGSSALPAVAMDGAMSRALEGIAAAYQNGTKIIGIPTGLTDIDSKMAGLCPGDLIVIAGRPGMGKSAILSTLLRNTARKGYRSMVASLEMSAEQLAERMISDTMFDFPGVNVPYSNLRTGNFHENMFQSITDAAEMNRDLPIVIEEQPAMPMSLIATRARRLKRQGKLDLLAIDHLDLVKPSQRYAGNKVYELGEITAAAKALAKELKIPVVLLCQLSREVEKREDKRPMLSDLRSSGSIEQDADAVIFLYRPAYYLQTEPKEGTPEHLEWREKVQDAANKLIAIIAKQRMGPTGPVELFCDIANNAVRDMGGR